MAKPYRCPFCDNPDPIPPGEASCPACQKALPAPNVRAAETEDEKVALAKRISQAEADVTARKCLEVLQQFGEDVSKSNAVICRGLGEIQRIVNGPGSIYSSYYKHLDAGMRLPEDNEFDQDRESVDSRMFPNYHKEIVFAALTLNDQGAGHFGGHAMILKDEMIAHRASVFEMNTVQFFRQRKLSYSDPVPPGFRSIWAERGQLAKAKLHSKLDATTAATKFPGILIDQTTVTPDADFMEVHIFQGFSRGALAKVRFGKTRREKTQIRSLKTKLDGLGIPHEGP